MTSAQLAARITRRYDKIIADLEQLIRDKESWNDNRLEEIHFDVAAERSLLAKERAARAAWLELLADDTPETRARHAQLARDCTDCAVNCLSDDLDTE